MKGEYRFLMSRGSSRFAKVGVASEPGDAWTVALSPSLGRAVERWGDELKRGVWAAAHAHEMRGGAPQQVMVETLVEQAYRCAAPPKLLRSLSPPGRG